MKASSAAIAGLTLAALALRLYRIDAQSVWVDEAFTIHAALQRWPAMIDILVADFNHPPLHTVLVRGWFALVGPGAVEARVLSAVAGTLAVPALYWLGVQIFDRRAALLASALLAVSQLGIVYSQEARGYSLLLLLTLVATGFFVRAHQRHDGRAFAAFVGVACLMVYTHYYAAFAVLAMAAFAISHRRASAIPGRWWAAALAVATVAYLPWMTSGVVQSALQNPGGASVQGVAGHLASPAYALNWFNNGKLAGVREPAPLWAFVAGLVVFTVPAVRAVAGMRSAPARERDGLRLLLLGIALPITGVWLLGFLRVVYDVRHVAFAAAPYYLLVAYGVTRLPAPPWTRLGAGAAVAFSMLSFGADYFVPYKENYRDALQVVAASAAAGDCTVFAAPDGRSYGMWYWTSYYFPAGPPGLTGQADVPLGSECRRAWIVWDGMFWKGGPQTYAELAATLGPGFQPEGHWPFLGVDVHLLVRRPTP